MEEITREMLLAKAANPPSPLTEIKGFFGPFRFLSNYHFTTITYEGISYRTTEHAYQAAKSLDVRVRERIRQLYEPKDAKKAGQTIEIRPDWEDVKVQVMLGINRLKYEQEPVRTWLLDTGDAYLEETNWWGDKFWGVCNGVGENNLGKVLMRIRQEIKESRSAGQ